MTTPAARSGPGPAVVAVHGGAGRRTRQEMGEPRVVAVRATIEAGLRAAAEILGDGGDALDAVVAAVCVLEDGPELNAGRGSALTEGGTVEMCAGVADGRTRAFGGAAIVTRPRHPVELARLVLLEGRHVLVGGAAADELAAAWGLRLEDPSWFVTDRQREFLGALPESGGTVGAVARDRHGHLAAATSTGGVPGKRSGRIGDSPLAGAGTWADDRSCAVSATGDGELFIRAGFAHEVHARLRHGRQDLAAACRAALTDVTALGGSGGCVAVDRDGRLALPFTSAAMIRGWCIPGGPVHTGVDPGECEAP